MVLDHCDLFYIIQGVCFNGQKFCGKGLSNIFAVTLLLPVHYTRQPLPASWGKPEGS